MFNNTVRKRGQNKVMNDAGYMTYKLPDDKAYFFMSCGFKPFNSAYRDALENLERFITVLNNTDHAFAHASTWYLGNEFGLRLAPAIATAELFDKYNDTKRIKRIVNDVFVRPDFFAHALDYYKFKHHLKSLNHIPREFLEILRDKFERLPAHTLKNRKMRRREIKTKDLIKVLRPHPKNEEMSRLYKSIIEDGPESKLQVEVDEDGQIESADHITSALSDDSISSKEKQKYISGNVDNINLNSLIRNLGQLEGEDSFSLRNRLIDAHESDNARKLINPLDLIMPDARLDPRIIETLDHILEKYYSFDFDVENPLILLDNSGSMWFSNEPMQLATKYITLLKSLFEKDSLRFFAFHNRCFEITQKMMNLEGLPHNEFARKFYYTMKQMDSGGTALLDSMKKALKRAPEVDSIIILTDEQTWCENRMIDEYKNILSQFDLGGRAILINTDPVGNNTVFEPDSDIFRIGGREGKIVDALKAIYNWRGFRHEIIERFEEKV